MRLILSAALVLGSIATATACQCEVLAAAPADIALADLKSAIAAKQVVLIDANGSKSFAVGHLPGAIDFEASKADLAKVLPADKGALIVAYCGGPKCSAWKDAASAVVELGYTQVKHFSGGLKGWQEGGEKLVSTTN